jgi:hypothetical protein
MPWEKEYHVTPTQKNVTALSTTQLPVSDTQQLDAINEMFYSAQPFFKNE